eukprot:1832633-Prorocentrum_lima.AAC.1
MRQEPSEGWAPTGDDMETGGASAVSHQMSADAPPFVTANDKLRDELIRRVKAQRHAPEANLNHILDP